MKKSTVTFSPFLYIIFGIIIGFSLKFFVFDILHISGHSMEPTFMNNDSVVVFKLAYGIPSPSRNSFLLQWAVPKRNDIVIFLHDNKIVTKRCIAVSGDQLDFSTNSGYILTVNDKSIFLTPQEYEKMNNYEKVPEGYVLVLGDNLSDSVDSRDYGFVSVKNITGKIISR